MDENSKTSAENTTNESENTQPNATTQAGDVQSKEVAENQASSVKLENKEVEKPSTDAEMTSVASPAPAPPPTTTSAENLINLTIKTPKDKESVSLSADSTIKEVSNIFSLYSFKK